MPGLVLILVKFVGEKLGYGNRSEALRDLIRDVLVSEEVSGNKRVVAGDDLHRQESQVVSGLKSSRWMRDAHSLRLCCLGYVSSLKCLLSFFKYCNSV